MRRLLLPALAYVCITGCAVDADDDASSSEPPADSLVVAVSVGGEDERPEYEFGRLSGVAALPDGGVAVSDALNNVVRIYDEAGVHRYSFGRAGAGPGEMTSPCCVAVGPDRLLWVRDGDNSRYSAYRPGEADAMYVGQRRMQHTDVNRWAPLTFDGDGRLIDIGMRSDEPAGRGTYRLHLDSASMVASKVRVHAVPEDSTGVKTIERAGGAVKLFFREPYGPSDLTAHSPSGEFAHMLSSRYAVDWRDASGNLIRHVTADVVTGPELSADEIEAANKRLDSDAKRAGVSRGGLGFDVPARKQPVRDLFFDSNGRLWVELNVPQGSPHTADVYARDGSLDRRATWPHDVSLDYGAVTGNSIWGVRTDSLDVQTLVRLDGLGDRSRGEARLDQGHALAAAAVNAP